MYFDPIYMLQRPTLIKGMHVRAVKLYNNNAEYPYIQNLWNLQTQYVHRMRQLGEMLERATRTKEIDDKLMDRLVMEFATNEGAHACCNYQDVVALRNMMLAYPFDDKPEEKAHFLSVAYGCVQCIINKLPEILPTPETAAQQMQDIEEFLEWQCDNYSLNIRELVRYTHPNEMSHSPNTYRNAIHPKSVRVNDYAFNVDAVIYSTLRLLTFDKRLKTENTALLYWCCVYLRYCRPALNDVATYSRAYTNVQNVVNILHNEWKYIAHKYH